MGDNTKILWADATINALNGCGFVSEGCRNCYAVKSAHLTPAKQPLLTKFKQKRMWNSQTSFNVKAVMQPLKWKKPRRILWNNSGDMFHPNNARVNIMTCLAVMALTPQHTHIILTKFSQTMSLYMASLRRSDKIRMELVGIMRSLAPAGDRIPAPRFPLPNIWCGVSIEDQVRAEDRIKYLSQTPAALRFALIEPLLSRIDLDQGGMIDQLDWVIVSGESAGPASRPMHPNWVRSIRDTCDRAQVPFLFQQWGDWHPFNYIGDLPKTFTSPEGSYGSDRIMDYGDGLAGVRMGKKKAGRMLDGQEYNGMPTPQS